MLTDRFQNTLENCLSPSVKHTLNKLDTHADSNHVMWPARSESTLNSEPKAFPMVVGPQPESVTRKPQFPDPRGLPPITADGIHHPVRAARPSDRRPATIVSTEGSNQESRPADVAAVAMSEPPPPFADVPTWIAFGWVVGI